MISMSGPATGSRRRLSYRMSLAIWLLSSLAAWVAVLAVIINLFV